MKIALICIILLTIITGVWFFVINDVPGNVPNVDHNTDLSFLMLPEQLTVEVVADKLDKPRVMIFDVRNRMLVSQTQADSVVIFDVQQNGSLVDNPRTLLSNLNNPHGLALYNARGKMYLYVAESDEVVRYVYNEDSGTVQESTRENIANLPDGDGHFTRTILIGSDLRIIPAVSGGVLDGLLKERIYISVGSSCNVCVESTFKRSAILDSDPEGTFTAEFAGGLRNSVFMAFHPVTGQLWATEMGRDHLGDNLPPDEVNIILPPVIGEPFGAKRFGWPYCYGDQVRDTSFDESGSRVDLPKDCTKTVKPSINLPAHSAPLGIAFFPATDLWPAEWHNDVLIALHGSWNRSEKVGYKVVRYDLDSQGKVQSGPHDFISGFLAGDGETVRGRPVDLKFGPDGGLYMSDDGAGVIYRITPK